MVLVFWYYQMEVSFVESVIGIRPDSVIIVSHNSGFDFIEKKIKEIAGIFPDNVAEKIKDLSYKKSIVFDLPVNGNLVAFVIIGAGKKEELTEASLKKLGGYTYDAIKGKELDAVLFNNLESVYNESAAILLFGIELKSWTFDKYKSQKTDRKIKNITCETPYIALNQQKYTDFECLREGIFKTREMVTEPANVMDPDKILEEAEDLKKLGVKVNCLDKKDLEKLGMNAMIGVGLGSDKPTYLITMEYKTDKSKPTIALVGKGLTFDSGGLCIKPARRMGEMKGDMTGAAVVIGAVKSMALRQINANIVGVIGVVENMISGSAQKPGDVVISMSGKSIEVDNTDAEGRLVLADALWYTQEKFNPDVMVDFATLTGAIQIALGHEFAGLFSNSEVLATKLAQSSRNVGEKLWELPLHDSYEDDLKSQIADIINTGAGRGAGSITAALFLKHFVKDTIKWAHIDIAATEWDSKNRALSQKGATGFGVALINDFVESFYKQ